MPIKPLTYGLEIECAEVSPESTRLEQEYSFSRHFDRTIRGPNGEELPRETAAELITLPLAVDVSISENRSPSSDTNINAFVPLSINFGGTKEVVEALCRCLGKVNKSCGVHVHIGKPNGRGGDNSYWSESDVRTWITVCCLLEERLFTLVPSSRADNQYCRKLLDGYNVAEFKNTCPLGHVSARKYDNRKRYCWLNLIETKRENGLGTVEIRMLGNTKRFDYIWAWTQLWIKIGAIIAYWPSSQAIMSITMSDLLDPDMLNVKRIKDIPENRRQAGVAPTTANIQPRIRRADRT